MSQRLNIMDYSLLLGVHDLDRAVEDAQQVLDVLKVAQVKEQVEEPQHLGANTSTSGRCSTEYININN